MIAPLRNVSIDKKPWEGNIIKKPWEYETSAVIPVIDTWESLQVVIDLLRLQTIRPYIMVIDTGSTPENLQKILAMASDDVEVHSIRVNAVSHPSDFPCFAQDLAHALCRTKYLFCTHSDVFLKTQFVLEEMVELCNQHPVVGYQITERPHSDWVGMVGHTCMMYDVSIIDSYGITWSMRRICDAYEIAWCPDTSRPNWPDTEVGFNVLCREAGITPYIIGTENNFVRNVTPHFDHCRSMTGSLLYGPEYYAECKQWLVDAHREAKQRIADWSRSING